MTMIGKVTAQEAARILEIHHSTVRRLINRNVLSATMIFGNYLLDREEVRRFKKSYKRYARI